MKWWYSLVDSRQANHSGLAKFLAVRREKVTVEPHENSCHAVGCHGFLDKTRRIKGIKLEAAIEEICSK